MCQKKPGMRCSRHAHKANNQAYARVRKLRQANPTTFEDLHELRGAEMSHHFAVAMYYASPVMFKQLSKTSVKPSYQLSQYMHTTMSRLLKNTEDFNNDLPLQVGNKVKTGKGIIRKSPKSTMMIVNSRKKVITLWDEKDPYYLRQVNTNGEIVNIETIDPTKKVYGFETQKKPDAHWAIWYSAEGFKH